MIELKSEREIRIIRENGRIVALTLSYLKEKIKSGIKTIELDKLAEEFILKKNAIPAFKGYRGYAGNICTSINNEVVHGIPGERALKEGEIVSVDIGVLKNGFYADGAWTFPVGEISNQAKRLLEVTLESLEAGISQSIAGNRLGDISYAVQSIAEKNGYSVVRDLTGHGIGRQMHEDPPVPNFGSPGTGLLLKEGMILAIEPMVNAGGYEIKTLEDNWTVVTLDGSLSAHFEHTVAITQNGAEILTLPEEPF
ncbi:MAG: type I methionyl aminopeptidase [candidate division Zixibacteria bacterium]|nr:type I methionyl aminopeptidase [candidate division Zixibacteria bacterium]